MDIRQIIAQNLTAWMDGTPALSTLKKLSTKSKIGFGTVQRVKNAEGNLTVQNLEAIAQAFGRQALDLLRAPNPEFEQKPVLTVVMTQEPNPDERTVLEGFRVASPEGRRLMLMSARDALDNFNKRNEKNS